QELVSFAAALVALRLAGKLATRWRSRRAPELLAWSAALVAYAAACAALAWGAAAGWDARTFRVYYLFGGLLTAPLLGAGSLLLWRRRWAAPLALAYAGLAVGIAIAVPVHGSFAHGIPAAQDHLSFFPARLAAIVANSAGTLAVVVVAAATFARRPLGNALIVVGVGIAAAGTALAGLGAAGTAAFAAAAVVVLYAGFTTRGSVRA